MILRHIYKSFFACLIAISTIGIANAYAPNYYKSNSILSSGNWVKIKVTQIGMQEITHEQLREWGFSDPSKVCVYGYGGTQLTKNLFEETLPDDLPAQPVYYGEDKIIFYGEPDLRVNLGKDAYKINVVRNMYSSSGYYFLSDCNPDASKIPTAIQYNLSNIMSNEYHNHILYIENELDNTGKAGTYFFDKSIIGKPKEYKFSITKVYKPNNKYAGLRYQYAAKVPQYTALNVTFDYPDSLILKTKHNQVTPTSLSAIYFYTNDGEIDFTLAEKDSTYTFTFEMPIDKKATYAAMDYVYLAYHRQNNFENEAQMRMSFLSDSKNPINKNANFTISNGNENIQVWNVTNPLNIYPHSLRFNSTSKNLIGTFDKEYKFSTTGNACLVAFDPTKTMHKVEKVGNVANQDLHSLESPDMVIITNDLCEPYAKELAQAHYDYQNLNVLVVNQDMIFNEFSSGTPSAMAYRRFLKMLYDRNSSKLKYLLLFGEGSWDNRGVIHPKEGRLLTYQAENVDDARSAAKAFCGDNYFGMLNDDYDPDNFYKNEVHLGIGRIPAVSASNAQTITNKIIKYLQNPSTTATYNRALLLADEGDSFGHIGQQEENIDSINSLSPATVCTRAYIPLYPSTTYDAEEARNRIIQALNKGQGFLSFAGHGGESSFTAKDLWTVNHTRSNNYTHPPFAMYATCDAFSFDRREGGMAEAALYNDNGGAIAVVAASRTVYMSYNQYLNREFTCEFFKAGNDDLIGDVFRRARNQAATKITDRTLGVNTMCYNLAGDPALPLYRPTLNVTTASINNIEIKDSTLYKITPLSQNTITGHITDSNGNIDETFNGKITISIYDSPTAFELNNNSILTTDTVVNYDGNNFNDLEWVSSTSVGVVCIENLLTEITVPVTNGKYQATFATPVSLKANSYNHVAYYAISDDLKTRANGCFNYLSVTEYDENKAINDITAPIIEQCYINTPSFSNGDVVESNFTLYATIAADETGINTSSGSIGLATTLTLDGSKSYPMVQSAITTNADGTASLSFYLKEIEDGQHTLTLSVADNAGNRTNHTISFVVINNGATATLKVAETPVRTEATFEIEHNFLMEPSGRLIIEDTNGNTIFTKANCSFPYTWNLNDNNGNKVADGNYKAYTILNGGNQYGSSPKINIIVVK